MAMVASATVGAVMAMVASATVGAVMAMVASATVGAVTATVMTTTAMEEKATVTVEAWKADRGWAENAVAAMAEGMMVWGKGAGSMVVAKMIEMVAASLERSSPQVLEEPATETAAMLAVEGTDQPQSTLQQTQTSCPSRCSSPRTG